MSSLITFTSQYSEESEAKIPENEFSLIFFAKLSSSSLFKSCVELFERFARFCRTIVNIWPGLRSLSRFHQHLRLTVDILIFDIVEDDKIFI